MKTVKTMASLLLLSAVSVSPAYANWFSNPAIGVNLNVGSAPNPTPGDLRLIGDSRYGAPRVLHSEVQSVPAPVAYVTRDEQNISAAAMSPDGGQNGHWKPRNPLGIYSCDRPWFDDGGTADPWRGCGRHAGVTAGRQW